MTHKEICKSFALQNLTERGLAEYFNENNFDQFYQQQPTKSGNIYTVGLNAADSMLIASNSIFSPLYFKN